MDSWVWKKQNGYVYIRACKILEWRIHAETQTEETFRLHAKQTKRRNYVTLCFYHHLFAAFKIITCLKGQFFIRGSVGFA